MRQYNRRLRYAHEVIFMSDEPERRPDETYFGTAPAGRGRAWLVLIALLVSVFVIAALLGYFRL